MQADLHIANLRQPRDARQQPHRQERDREQSRREQRQRNAKRMRIRQRYEAGETEVHAYL